MTIRHCVVFRFVDGVDDHAVAALEAGLGRLPGAIPEIESYRFGRDLELRDTNADFAVVADFADEAGFLVYSAHPEHQAVIRDLVEPIVAERHSVQFEW
jgi:hypothetical protein